MLPCLLIKSTDRSCVVSVMGFEDYAATILGTAANKLFVYAERG